MTKNLLTTNQYAPYYGTYLSLVPDDNLLEVLEIAQHQFIKFVQDVPLEKIDYAYAPGKWTLKDMVQHIVDVERVFAYRALRIGRGDTTDLPGFDENEYADAAQANRRSMQGLLSEFAAVRLSTLCLFGSLSSEELMKMGTASGHNISPLALGYIIVGHQIHHMKVFTERY
ncbi:MAG: damage-inducible protein DinB [Flavobacterium sp. BFFFF2]|nr:MAG: damage-inducible protein DinB [Flavobacterium sp. BFFFF2]